MRRSLLVLVVGALLFFGGRAIVLACVSDATKITWVLEDEVAAFNAASVFAVMPRFAEDYRDGTGGIDRGLLAAGVVWVWQNRRDADGQFAWRVELPDGVGPIAVDGDAATASFPLALHAGRGEDRRLLWALQVTAHFARRDSAWWLVRSTHKTTAGRPPKPT